MRGPGRPCPAAWAAVGPVLTPEARPAARRYEKYDSLGATREKTDDPFTDELNMVLDKVQDLQLVRGVLPGAVEVGAGAWAQEPLPHAARAVAGCPRRCG